MSMGLRLAAPRAAGAPLIYIGCLVTLRTYVCSSVLTYANTLENKKSSTISIAVFLILGIHDIVHWHMSKRAICCDSGLDNFTTDKGLFSFLHWIGGTIQVITLREKAGIRARAKFCANSPLPKCSLHNRLVALLTICWKISLHTAGVAEIWINQSGFRRRRERSFLSWCQCDLTGKALKSNNF